jgi:hypothetical protein
MKIRMVTCGLCFLLASIAAYATPVLVVGTPADSYLATPTPALPNLNGITVNFDSLIPYTAASTFSFQGGSITSPDGLEVIPFSSQSAPNELFDTSAAGSANISINLTQGRNAIGVGIADSDAVTIVLQALGAGGTDLGSAFSVTIPEDTDNPGNAYFVVEDSSYDIYGLQITEAVSSSDFSGLAIDDVQVAPTPEPDSVVLMATGLFSLLGFNYSRMKRA